jgi:hypothetical protein
MSPSPSRRIGVFAARASRRMANSAMAAEDGYGAP